MTTTRNTQYAPLNSRTTQLYANRFNTIVVGLGTMGSAAAYYLARRGKRVLGLERFDIPHDQGSYQGYTRIIRMPYYEHPSYVMLLKRAYELWREIEQQSGQRLLYTNGSLDIGPADSWVFKGALRSAMEYELQHEVFTGLELAQRYPGYQLPHDIMALYQPDGGFLAPESCVVSYCFAAMRHGAELHGREGVLRWEPLPGGEGVRVYTERAIYEADSLVITAGAWNDEMLSFLRNTAVPELQVLAWFQPKRPEFFTQESFPVFNLLVDEGRYYGFPVHTVPGFKIGKYHHLEERGHPDALRRDVVAEDEEILRECVARYFPAAAGPVMTLKSCMFTNAPDGHFIIDLHPEHPQVSYASACSGHGFKFGSVIGEILADLAQYRQTRHNIDLFTHARFQGQSAHGFSGEHGALTPIYETAVRKHAKREQHSMSSPVRRTRHSHAGIHGAPYYEQQTSRTYGEQPSEQRMRQQAETIRSVW
ncbi:MAG: N-methyl-L-tryptophan oxidase [Caldilineaceae bacterium]|nr:N-methyl-L-tryptophan oxidase [Caldilineaceae bacterium]